MYIANISGLAVDPFNGFKLGSQKHHIEENEAVNVTCSLNADHFSSLGRMLRDKSHVSPWWSFVMTLVAHGIYFKTKARHHACVINEEHGVTKTSQELRMLSSVTINCQVTKIVMNPGSQLSVL